MKTNTQKKWMHRGIIILMMGSMSLSLQAQPVPLSDQELSESHGQDGLNVLQVLGFPGFPSSGNFIFSDQSTGAFMAFKDIKLEGVLKEQFNVLSEDQLQLAWTSRAMNYTDAATAQDSWEKLKTVMDTSLGAMEMSFPQNQLNDNAGVSLKIGAIVFGQSSSGLSNSNLNSNLKDLNTNGKSLGAFEFKNIQLNNTVLWIGRH